MSQIVLGSRVPIENMSTVDRVLSIVGGTLLAVSSVRRRSGSPLGVLAAAEMVRRGISGHCYLYQLLGVRTQPTDPWSSVSVPYETGVRASGAITLSTPRDRVFAFWRDLSNLPQVMQHLVAVEPVDSKTSHWVAEGPGGKRLEWDAEIINEIPGELLAWRSLPGSQVDSAGSVRFKDAPGGRGTELSVDFQYNPPAGFAGAYIAKLFNRDAEAEMERDLYRLRQYLDTGEVVTTKGQPRGRGDNHGPARPDRRSEPIAGAGL